MTLLDDIPPGLSPGPVDRVTLRNRGISLAEDVRRIARDYLESPHPDLRHGADEALSRVMDELREIERVGIWVYVEGDRG